jgi:hypothetical protein
MKYSSAGLMSPPYMKFNKAVSTLLLELSIVVDVGAAS